MKKKIFGISITILLVLVTIGAAATSNSTSKDIEKEQQKPISYREQEETDYQTYNEILWDYLFTTIYDIETSMYYLIGDGETGYELGVTFDQIVFQGENNLGEEFEFIVYEAESYDITELDEIVEIDPDTIQYGLDHDLLFTITIGKLKKPEATYWDDMVKTQEIDLGYRTWIEDPLDVCLEEPEGMDIAGWIISWVTDEGELIRSLSPFIGENPPEPISPTPEEVESFEYGGRSEGESDDCDFACLQECFNNYRRRQRQAWKNYHDDMDDARDDYHECVADVFIETAATSAACIAAGLITVGTVSHACEILFGAIHWEALTQCTLDYDTAKQCAKDRRDADLRLWKQLYNNCKDDCGCAEYDIYIV